MKVVLVVVAALALAGCEVGPNGQSRPSPVIGSAAEAFRSSFEKGTAAVADAQAKQQQAQPQRYGVFCPLKSEYVSGQNRICNYDCAGSANPVTKKSYEPCGGGFMKY